MTNADTIRRLAQILAEDNVQGVRKSRIFSDDDYAKLRPVQRRRLMYRVKELARELEAEKVRKIADDRDRIFEELAEQWFDEAEDAGRYFAEKELEMEIFERWMEDAGR